MYFLFDFVFFDINSVVVLIIWQSLISGESIMISKKILFISTDTYLIQRTKSRFQNYKNCNINIYNINPENAGNITMNAFDIIIVDSGLLQRQISNKTLSDFLNEQTTFSSIFLLDSSTDLQLPDNIKIKSIFSHPVLPEKLWKMIDNVLDCV